MDNEKINQLETAIKEINRKLDNKNKSWIDYLAPMSTFLSTVVIGGVGLYITNNMQSTQLETQSKIQRVQVLKDFLPYVGDSNTNRSKAALIAISSLGFDSLAIDFALGINNSASREVLTSRVETSVGDRKEMYKNALKQLQSESKDSVITLSYSKALNRAIKELSDSAREIPPGSNSGVFVEKYTQGLKSPWSGYFVSWCFLDGLKEEERPFVYSGSFSMILADVKSKGYWFSEKDIENIPQPGDIYFIQYSNGMGHGGLVYTVGNGIITGIEANTIEETEQGVQARKVALRTREIDKINGGFARIPE